MEQLTKQQIVLVTLLVSFVTSIATGIVTVALMDQAPPGVTQTINRVVEKTIEKVVPGPTQQATVVTRETVVVKEDDLVVSAIDKNTKSMVSIFVVRGATGAEDVIFLGNGLFVSKDGLIATDASIVMPVLDESGNPIPQSIKATFPDGVSHVLTLASSDKVTGLSILKPEVSDKTKAPQVTPATLSSAGTALKLGQTIIALGGEKVSVETGIVSNLSAFDGSAASETATSTPATSKGGHQIIKTDIRTVGKTHGAILVNLSGEVVGIRTTSAGSADNLFLPANFISIATTQKPSASN